MTEKNPPPLVGCLVCHSEGTTSLLEGRRFLGLGADFPVLECSACQSSAFLDWDESQPEHWRVKYRKISAAYAYAAQVFDNEWVEAEQAVELSTLIYVHRKRLEQTHSGDLSWLKPTRLMPPPPLMSPIEWVYLEIPSISYCETRQVGLLTRSKDANILDTGKFYVTDTKIHLLGQRRDRSHRLTDIRQIEFEGVSWYIHMNGERPYHYHGYSQDGILDSELIAAVITTLKKSVKE
ncbi:MAG: hypothetical protein K8I82_24130 [Anaerolineae bacterium]|nr:hypothetical protein [Anaerolineae bacterium]